MGIGSASVQVSPWGSDPQLSTAFCQPMRWPLSHSLESTHATRCIIGATQDTSLPRILKQSVPHSDGHRIDSTSQPGGSPHALSGSRDSRSVARHVVGLTCSMLSEVRGSGASPKVAEMCLIEQETLNLPSWTDAGRAVPRATKAAKASRDQRDMGVSFRSVN